MNKKIIIYGQIALILIVIYPVLSLFLNNINEVRFTEILLPIFINIMISELIFVIMYAVTRQYVAGIFYSAIMFYIGINFNNYFYKLIDAVYYWNAVPIVLYITIVILMIIHYTKIRIILDKLLLFATIGVLCSIGLVLFNNADKLVKQNIILDNITAANEIDTGRNVVKKQADLPNIYYIILDEYSSFKQMKKWYDYDNKEFYDFLKKNDFNIIEDSQNESINTLTLYITSNLLNLNYVSVDNNFFGAMKYKKSPYLFELLDKYGYSISHKGDKNIGWGSALVKVSSTTIEGKTLNDLIYGNNILYPLFEKNINAVQQYIEDLYTYFNNYAQNLKPSSSSFLYIHFPAGHVPLIFNENGINDSKQFFNMEDKSLYIGQVKHTNYKIMEILEKIITKDNKSIIIIQSDHSQRNLEDKNGNKIIPVKESQQVFNAVYYKGENITFDKTLSGVNTVRVVLDKALSTNLGVINVP